MLFQPFGRIGVELMGGGGLRVPHSRGTGQHPFFVKGFGDGKDRDQNMAKT